MSERLRVLVICEEDPEWLLGGMGRHLRELYRAMSERDDVEIDMLVGGPADGHYDYFGFEKYHSDKLVCWKPQAANMSSYLVAEIQMARTLAKLLADGKRYDVVHAHEWNAVQIARMARDALRVPLIGTMHLCLTHLMSENPIGDPPKYSEPDVYLMQMEGHLICDSDELILCSRAFEKIIRRNFMTERRINIVENGIRCDEWSKDSFLARKARTEFGLADRRVALFVGRIADMKGIRELVEAVRRKDTGYLVVLAGEVNANTEEEKELWEVTQEIRRTEAEFPERLRWVGFQGDELLKGLYSLAEVGLMPSLHEPFGIVALEFLSMGVPLISTEADGLSEIVLDEDGNEYALIIEPSSDQINQALELLWNDAEARDELSELGRRRALDFDWREAASRTVDVYRKIIKERRCYVGSIEEPETVGRTR
jgi:glycosyltransferase involved in cell wall biosynthesis